MNWNVPSSPYCRRCQPPPHRLIHEGLALCYWNPAACWVGNGRLNPLAGKTTTTSVVRKATARAAGDREVRSVGQAPPPNRATSKGGGIINGLSRAGSSRGFGQVVKRRGCAPGGATDAFASGERRCWADGSFHQRREFCGGMPGYKKRTSDNAPKPPRSSRRLRLRATRLLRGCRTWVLLPWRYASRSRRDRPAACRVALSSLVDFRRSSSNNNSRSSWRRC